MEPNLFKIKLPDGQDSVQIDSSTLLSYARAGHVTPVTWVFDIQQGRWMSAQQTALLSTHWGGPGAPPPYAQGSVAPGAPGTYGPGSAPAGQYNPGPYGQPLYNQRSSPAAKNNSLAIVMSIVAGVVAVLFCGFLLLRPAIMKFTDAGPPQVVSTSDGLYKITIPSSWAKYSDSDATAISYVNIGDTLAVRIHYLDTGNMNLDGLRDLSTRMATRMSNKEDWTPDGPQQTTTVGPFPAISQAYTQQKGLTNYSNHIVLVNTPNGTYDFVQVVAGDEPGGQETEDKILNSFRVK